MVGDTCSTAEALDAGPGRLAGTTVGYANDFTSNCGSAGPDHFYRFTLTQPAVIHVQVTSVSAGWTASATLFDSASTCPSLSEVACGTAQNAAQDLDVTSGTSPRPAGTYYLAVDSLDGGAGTYVVGIALDLADGGTTFCQRMNMATRLLRNALVLCPGSGDSSIYGFNRATCDTQAPTQCSGSDMTSLDSVAACDMTIAPCASPADRTRVMGDISACGTDASVSSACLNAMGS